MDFLGRLLAEIDKKGITKNKLLTDLKLSKNSFVAWESRGTIPNGETVATIAKYFNVSTDYLLGRSDNPYLSSDSDSGAELIDPRDIRYGLYDSSEGLDKDDIDEVVEFIKFKQMQKKNKKN